MLVLYKFTYLFMPAHLVVTMIGTTEEEARIEAKLAMEKAFPVRSTYGEEISAPEPSGHPLPEKEEKRTIKLLSIEMLQRGRPSGAEHE